MTLAVLTTAGLAFALLQLMIVPALPALRHEYDVGADAVMWVITIFMITTSIATPIFGRLGDMFGKDRVLVLVMLIFALGTLLCALAPSLGLLIAGRAVQGTGGAIFPLAFGIIRDEFPPGMVALGIGLMSSIHGIGGAAGLVVSGVIVDHLDYTWIFWLGLMVTVPAIVATRLFVPSSPVRAPAQIDWLGALLMSAALGTLLLGVTKVGTQGPASPVVLALLGTAAALTTAWALVERRVPQPLVDMGLMRLRSVWTTNVAALTLGFGMQSSILVLPQLVQVPASGGFGFGASATEAGLYLVPHSAAIIVGAPLAGWMGQRLGSRVPLLIGIGLAFAGLLQIMLAHDQPWQVLLHAFGSGLSVGMAFTATMNLIVGSVPQTSTGMATGMNMIMRSIGGAWQAQVSGAILTATAVAGVLTERGFELVFLVSAAILVPAFVVGLLIPPARRRGGPASLPPIDPAA